MANDSLKFDLSDLPVVDNHCHLFNTTFKSHDPSAVLSMSLNDMPAEQRRHTMIYRYLLRELRHFWGMKNVSDEILLSERLKRMKTDYTQWVADIFSDVRIHALIVDLGYQPAVQSLDDFENLVPARVHYMFRIESVLDELWENLRNGRIDFPAAEDQYFAALEEGLNQPGIVAAKSIIGYRTGLEIQPVVRKDLQNTDPTEKAFRDYFFAQTLAKAAEINLPVQIHASFGESNIDMRRNHPGMLKWVLDQPTFRDVRIVLVHGGYPHSFAAGYLAAVYPNVYVDISAMFPFVPLGSRQGLRDIFDMCPFNKIMYG
ncbi:MAG: amidohydrolase family protein, partial [Deltaproteobacteria bacterium]|nr:amidohydrolase family protein [Deltaproteobacteria bacterium]